MLTLVTIENRALNRVDRRKKMCIYLGTSADNNASILIFLMNNQRMMDVFLKTK